MSRSRLPERQGLYDPMHEHDACGVGFVVNMKGVKSHTIIEQGLQILANLTHRGACGCDPLTGDGAGILTQMPDAFLRKVCAELDITLPAAGEYGAGMVFLPERVDERNECLEMFEKVVREEGQRLLGWRRVPVDARLVVARTRDGARSFEVLTDGLPQGHAYDLIYRHALAVDATGEVLAMGSTTGHLWVSENGGDGWLLVAGHLPPINCVRFG